MRLSSFIRENLERILQEWEDFARTLSPLRASGPIQLRDHAKKLLNVVCADLDTFQNSHHSVEKSRGTASQLVEETPAELHAVERVESGFSIEDLMAEYRALRASVLRLWQAEIKNADEDDMRQMARFNEAIDQELTESVARYSSLVRDAQNVFLAILGHDVRNPLGSISMASQLLMHDKQLDRGYVRVASQILGSADRINAIVSDLLDFATTQLGSRMPLTTAKMDFTAETGAIVDELRTLYPDREICLTTQSNLTVYWDKARVGQALSNLIANAIHHGSPGTPITVCVSGDDRSVHWTIHNEGDVIDAEKIQSITGPVGQLSIHVPGPREARNDGHFGLGLYITRLIVEGHKGTINVQSMAVEGTTFTVSLPRKPELAG